VVFLNVALIFLKLRGKMVRVNDSGDFEKSTGSIKSGNHARYSKLQSADTLPKIVLDFHYHIVFTNS